MKKFLLLAFMLPFFAPLAFGHHIEDGIWGDISEYDLCVMAAAAKADESTNMAHSDYRSNMKDCCKMPAENPAFDQCEANCLDILNKELEKIKKVFNMRKFGCLKMPYDHEF